MLVQIFVRSKILVLVMASVLASSAMAAEPLEEMPADAPKPAEGSSKARVGNKGKTVYLEFGNELIDGTGVKPSLEYLFTRSQFNYKRLIRLRENFQPEVKQGRGDFSGSGR